MANDPYAEAPSVRPEVNAPNDYDRVDATPSMFGGAIAQGAEQLGAGATRASLFYGKVAADDQTNQFFDQTNKILHGDPNKQIAGPDGKMQPDTGYFGLKGQDAMNARANIEKSIDDNLAAARKNLTTPEQQLQFDQDTRRYRQMVGAQISTHADQQFSTWSGEVNTSASNLALQHIAANADNPQEVAHGLSDLVQARIKQAQIAGAKDGDPVYQNALDGAKRDALKVQLEAIAVKDPARAADILEKNKNIAGAEYEPLANSFRSRAQQAEGIAAGQRALGTATAAKGFANPSLPVFAQAAGAVPGGYSPTGLARTVQIESGGRAAAGAGTAHQGLGQFSPSTWAAYGEGSPLDPQQAILATQRYAAANAPILRKALGRDPTDAELYLAHQQGPAGAVKLLMNPNARAGDLVGDAAIRGNMGDPNGTAAQFVNRWQAKFGGAGIPSIIPGGGQAMTMPASVAGTPQSADAMLAAELAATEPTPPVDPTGGAALSPVQTPQGVQAPAAPAPATGTPAAGTPAAPAAAPSPSAAESAAQAVVAQDTATRKAMAYQEVLNDQHLDPVVKEHALHYIGQQIQAETIAEQADAKAKEERSEKVADQFFQRVENGNYNGLHDAIVANPDMKWQTKHALLGVLETATGERGVKNYGPGYAELYRRIMLPDGDPNRINDPTEILRHGAPGGDLTSAGAGKLFSMANAVRRSVDDAAVHEVKSHFITDMHSRMSFEENTGPIKIRDPEGESRFNTGFIPAFEAAYDKAVVKGGEDPWKFLTRKNIDEIAKPFMRSQAAMNAAKLAATGEATGEPADIPLPPPPASVNPVAWRGVLTNPPMGTDGKPFPQWSQAISMLAANPTPQNIQAFNSSKFGRAGYDARQILQMLRGQPAAPAAAPAPAPAPVSDADASQFP